MSHGFRIQHNSPKTIISVIRFALPMKCLPTQLQDDGFDFNQLKRNDFVCLYIKSKSYTQSVTYEVIIPDHKYKKEWIEVYPNDEQWGIRAWTYTNLADAEVRYAAICDWHTQNAEEFEGFLESRRILIEKE